MPWSPNSPSQGVESPEGLCVNTECKGPSPSISDSAGLGQGPGICISHTFPGGADATCLEATRGEHLT